MPNNDGDAAFEIGFGKPPKHSRFRKGLSGNPKGRPKGRPNMATVLERALREKVVINENGRRRTITKLEAAVAQLVNKAASGDLIALRQLVALNSSAEDQVVAPPSKDLADADMKVMQGVLKRLEGCIKGENNDS